MKSVSTVDHFTSSRKIAGAHLIVLENGQEKVNHTAGFADIEKDKRVGPDTIFRLASITKPIVSVAALLLIERGTLALTDKVTDFLPGFRPALPDGTVPEIEIRHLLSHQSGLSYPFFEPKDSDYWAENISIGVDQPGLQLSENLQRLSRTKLSFAPGDSWRYSMSLDVLGAVLECATGQGLPAIIAETITGPLDMQDTAFSVADPERLATPYQDGSGTAVPMSFDRQHVDFAGGIIFSPARVFDETSYPSGGVGLNGTAPDLIRFFEELRTGSRHVISQAVRDQVFSNQVGDAEVFTLGPGWGFSFACAVQTQKSLTTRNLHNDGTIQWGGIWGHHWFIDPVANLTFLQLTNTAMGGMKGPFPDSVAKDVYEDLGH